MQFFPLMGAYCGKRRKIHDTPMYCKYVQKKTICTRIVWVVDSPSIHIFSKQFCFTDLGSSLVGKIKPRPSQDKIKLFPRFPALLFGMKVPMYLWTSAGVEKSLIEVEKYLSVDDLKVEPQRFWKSQLVLKVKESSLFLERNRYLNKLRVIQHPIGFTGDGDHVIREKLLPIWKQHQYHNTL